jgi:hypothetical protein
MKSVEFHDFRVMNWQLRIDMKWKSTDLSEEDITAIFRVEKQAK